MEKIDWLSPTQIKSLVDGGSMFFEIISSQQLRMAQCGNSKIIDFAKLQIGDEFYVQEEFTELNPNQYGYKYSVPKKDWDWFDWHSKKEMQPDQSRAKGKIKNRELVIMQDVIEAENIIKLGFPYKKCDEDGLMLYEWLEEWFNKICEEKNLNITYDDNPYIILYEIS